MVDWIDVHNKYVDSSACTVFKYFSVFYGCYHVKPGELVGFSAYPVKTVLFVSHSLQESHTKSRPCPSSTQCELGFLFQKAKRSICYCSIQVCTDVKLDWLQFRWRLSKPNNVHWLGTFPTIALKQLPNNNKNNKNMLQNQISNNN